MSTNPNLKCAPQRRPREIGRLRSATRSRLALLLLSSLGALGFTSPAAFGSYTASSGQIYYTPNSICLDGYSEVSDGIGYGYLKARPESTIYEPVVQAPCENPWDRPPGLLAATFQLWKYFQHSQQWGVCQNFTWGFNSTTSDSYTDRYTEPGPDAPCGPGYYDNYAANYVSNGSWIGAWIFSGVRYLP